MDQKYVTKEKVEKLLQEIDELPNPERIALKRNSGKLLEDADARARIAFYKALSKTGNTAENEKRLFPIACMYCMWKTEEVREQIAVPFEDAMQKRINQEKTKVNTEKRLFKLLDQKWDDQDGLVCRNIWRMIRQIKNEDKVLIDMVSLGIDFCKWNYSNQPVQKQWVKVCYGTKKEEEENVN